MLLSRIDGESFWDIVLVSCSPEVSSYQQMFYKKAILKTFAKFMGKLL